MWPNVSFQGKENHDGHDSSSPDMISFDLSNGDQYPPHLRMALDNDQYVEYQMEDMADFPSNAEEEERVRSITGYSNLLICLCSIVVLIILFLYSDAYESGDGIVERLRSAKSTEKRTSGDKSSWWLCLSNSRD